MVCSASLCHPLLAERVHSRSPIVSITSVSPSHFATAFPMNVRSTSAGCGLPIGITRKKCMYSYRKNDRIRSLDDLLGVRRERLARMAVR